MNFEVFFLYSSLGKDMPFLEHKLRDTQPPQPEAQFNKSCVSLPFFSFPLRETQMEISASCLVPFMVGFPPLH